MLAAASRTKYYLDTNFRNLWILFGTSKLTCLNCDTDVVSFGALVRMRSFSQHNTQVIGRL